eukprot:PRCOL_00000461-RA
MAKLGALAAAAAAAAAARALARARRGSAGGAPANAPARKGWSELRLEVLGADDKAGGDAGAPSVVCGAGSRSSAGRGSAGLVVVGRAGTEAEDVTQCGWLGIEDHGVSSRHLEVQWHEAAGAWMVRDRGSLNGTLLNGAGVSAPENRSAGASVALAHGDVLTLCARVRVLVRILGDGAAAHAPRLHASVRQAASVLPGDARRRGSGDGGSGGNQRAMEDVVVSESPLRGCPEFGLFGVFDGHCGVLAATRAAAAFPEVLSRMLQAPARRRQVLRDCDAAGLLREAFAEAERAVLHEHKCDHEGCTATVVLTWRDTRRKQQRAVVQIANVGDSAAVLGSVGAGEALSATANGSAGGGIEGGARASADGAASANCACVILTSDHTLLAEGERQRLAEAGVSLRDGERRLYGLAVSRVLGDGYLKSEDVGLSAEPSVSDPTALVGPGDVLVVASDGLWDVTTPEQAVSIATLPWKLAGASASSATVQSEANDAAAAQDADVGVSAAVGAANLMGHARAMRSRDNVSVVVIREVPGARPLLSRKPSHTQHASAAHGGVGAIQLTASDNVNR